ncbi:MAG: cobalt-precorrin-5B (C(1))-methyltransferase [Oligoflexus sp.]
MHQLADVTNKSKGMRTGYTTGACSAAAAKAAVRAFLSGSPLTEITSMLPNRQKVTFPLHRCEIYPDQALCSIIKDGGDDPDCTHGAELVTVVQPNHSQQIILQGGVGVATVTKPGLGLDLGGPAINPVPRQNITEMVLEELEDSAYSGATVTISVPDGEERAKKTLNARLGLLGGISILGTTGLVLPYSTSAFIASVVQAIALAAHSGAKDLVFTTGGRSETYAMRLVPELPECAFIQVGDYIGIALRNSLRQGIKRVHIVGMMGKLTKMADGRMMTHASASEVNVKMLADMLAELGSDPHIVQQAAEANTARHVLELCQSAKITGLPDLICKKVAEHCYRFAREHIAMFITMVDFDGQVLGGHQKLE